MYDPRPQFKFQDLRLQQRKTRMEAYQVRKQKKDQELEHLTNIYLQVSLCKALHAFRKRITILKSNFQNKDALNASSCT
jgi:hypothetical protein